MLKTYVLTLVKFVTALPLVFGFLYGLLQVAGQTNFKAYNAASYAKLVNGTNWLLQLLIEHWFGYILFCNLAAMIWALLVAEPRRLSKDKFKAKRKHGLGR